MKNLCVKLFSILILTLLTVACGGNVELDNAGDKAMAIKIGADRYVVPGGESQVVNIKEGRYKVELTDLKGTIFKDTLVNIVEGGLFNLAAAEYLIWKDIFSPIATLEMRKELLDIQPLQMGNQTFDIEYEIVPTTTFFKEKTWDLGLQEDFPTKVYGWELDKDKQYMFKTKIVRKDQFVSTYLRSSEP